MSDECQRCGACCFSDSSAYVPLTPADRARLGPALAPMIHEEDGGHYMLMADGHCATLIVVGAAFVCSIYDRRPDVCRELDRGSAACREERELKRLGASRLL